MAPSPTPTIGLQAVGGATLPMAGTEPERADAARNRRRLLDAAATLVRQHGADAVTMDAVAQAAGVGKGTVFRRFGDRAGLMSALLDHTETEMQEAFLHGPPPLGPGADPVERLIAFGCARLRIIELHGALLRAANEGQTRFSAPARGAHLAHVSALLREAGVDGDVPLLADTLLAALDAALVHHQQAVLGYPRERLHAGWTDLVRRVTRTCGG